MFEIRYSYVQYVMHSLDTRCKDVTIRSSYASLTGQRKRRVLDL